MSLGVRILPDTLRTVAFGGITGTYAAVGTPTTFPARTITLQNLTEQPVFFSLDGVHNHYVVAAQSGQVYDLTANKATDPSFIANNTQFWVKSVSVNPTLGAVYVGMHYTLGN